MSLKRPGSELANRPLHFFWICDCSGSMSVNGKIQSLNYAIKNSVPLMRDAANENANANVLVRALKFSSGAQWHVAQPTPVEDFEWPDLTADGVTDMGKALTMIADQLKVPPMDKRALPPVLVLISDGQPTDDFSSGIKALMGEPWGQKAVRIAISVGTDADNEVLQKFIGNTELKPLSANNPDELVNRIKWVSTAVIKATSNPKNLTQDFKTPDLKIPTPQVPNTFADSLEDVW